MNRKYFKNLILVASAALLTACGTTSETSVPTLVEALDNSAWNNSAWISVKNAPVVTGRVEDGCRAADGANWFVTSIPATKKIKSAKWMTAGLGVYELYVNGQKIGNEILKPGFTHFAKTKRSFTYDITSVINKNAGEVNQLAVQVTPGWWADKIITPGGNDGMYGKKCAFRGVVEITFADGSTQLLGTNSTDWKAGIAGPVTHAAIFDGEDYDARIPLGFETPEKLSAPETNNEFAGEILPTNGAEIYLRNDIALSPIKAYTWNSIEGATDDAYGKVVISKEWAAGEVITLHPGENLVIDFGQNCAGVPSFVFNAKEGTKLTCITSELLNDGNGAKKRGMDGPEGSVHRDNLRIPKTGMMINYTFANSATPVEYHPERTFFGYRLISITATDDVTFTSIKSIPVSSISKELEIGKISTGNDDVNKLISNTYWGQLSNYLSVPTDCPQRNERLGWMADTQVFTETGSFFANTDSFFSKWMRDVRDSQGDKGDKGGYPGVAPTAQYGNEMMRVGWADAGIICPWTIWKQYADTDIVNDSWASMERFIDHVAATKYDHNALIEENGNYQWADWLSYEALESCSGRAFGPNGPLPDAIEYWKYLCASYWIIDAEMMRDMAKATGRDASKYEKMAAEAKEYVSNTFINSDGSFKLEVLNSMQTPALFALKNNLVEGTAKENMLARLRQNFKEHDNCLQTGFLGTSILMSVLTENGMSDIAYNLLLQHKNPSWLYSVDNGATTIWERWNSYVIETGMGPQGMNSFNHYAYGAVCQWIWETVAGIAADPAQPGFKHIIMRPIPDKRLGHIDAEYHSAAGTIKSNWKYEGDKCVWNFTIPKGATATVTLPGETKSKDYNAGNYTVEIK